MEIDGGEKMERTRRVKRVLDNITTVSPHDISALPPHINAEANRLREMSTTLNNSLSEFECRPLVHSTGIWMIRNGITHTSDHPGVYAKINQMLHEIVPMNMLTRGNKGSRKPTSFGSRIEDYIKNYIRNVSRDFKLEVAADEVLSTPLRALQKINKLKVCEEGEEPIQGHSGKSIIGKGRKSISADNSFMKVSSSKIPGKLDIPEGEEQEEIPDLDDDFPAAREQEDQATADEVGETKRKDGPSSGESTAEKFMRLQQELNKVRSQEAATTNKKPREVERTRPSIARAQKAAANQKMDARPDSELDSSDEDRVNDGLPPVAKKQCTQSKAKVDSKKANITKSGRGKTKQLSQYEEKRNEAIASNQEVLKKLGLGEVSGNCRT